MSLLLSLALLFASDLEQPRGLLALDDGTVLVSRPELNDVIALRDRNGDGRADEIRTALSSIEGANAMAMHGDTLYVAGANAVFAAERSADGSFSEPQEIVPETGAIGIGPDGLLYLATRDRLLQFDAEGGGRRIYSRGALTAFGWDAATLWGVDESGALQRIGDGVREPSSLRVSSSALAFANNEAFAASKDGIVRIAFENGKPRRTEELIPNVHASALAAAKDGTLFYSDGANVYRVSSTPPPMTSSGLEPVKTILAKAFHLDGLRAPASVVHDEEQDVYFVANAGFVSRVTPAGKIEEPKFIDGLGSPQGMAIRGTQLWIADGAKVRVFDRVSGAAVKTIDLASRGAVSLRGVAVGGDDAVYVTDSDVRVKASKERVRAGDGRIFRISGDVVDVALAGEDLHSPNAIAWDGLRFLIAQGYGHEVVAWNPGGGTKAVMRGPGAYDGIVVLPNGTVIVSSEYDEALHVGYGGGDLRPLFTRKPTPAGIGFDRKRNRLLVPSRDGNWLEAWTLPPMTAPRSTSGGKARDMALVVLK
jgi:glucose/arabinose dehydrogenase